MKTHMTKTGLVVLAALLGVSVAAQEPRQLRHNPFTRPPSESTRDIGETLLADGSVQPLDLKATMVASSDRLANVAGRILRPGDEVAGYTLLQVFEDRAIFSRAGKQLTIYVKPDLVKDDE